MLAVLVRLIPILWRGIVMLRWFRALLFAGLAHLSLVLPLAALAGLALLGHKYDWKVPPFAEVWGGSKKAPAAGEQAEGDPESLPLDETQVAQPVPVPPALRRLELGPGAPRRAGLHLALVQQWDMI